MFRNLLIASLPMLMCGVSMAASIAGRHTGNSPFGAIQLDLQGDNGAYTGTLKWHTDVASVSVRENNGRLVGACRFNGQDVPFLLIEQGGSVALRTVTGTYPLQRQALEQDRPAADIAPINPLDKQDGPAEPQNPAFTGEAPAATPQVQLQVTPRQGMYFGANVPNGWRGSESTNGTTLTAPDGSAEVAFAGLEGIRGTMTPQAFIQKMAAAIGCRDLRLANARMDGGKFVAEIALTDNQGRQKIGVVSSIVRNAYGQYDAYITYAVATPEAWRAAGQSLLQVADSIHVTNASGAFTRAERMKISDRWVQVSQHISNNNAQTLAGIVGSGQYRDAVQGKASRMQQEGMMGYQTTRDPVTGQRFYPGLNTYDPTLPGYRNPNRPGEALEVVPYGE